MKLNKETIEHLRKHWIYGTHKNEVGYTRMQDDLHNMKKKLVELQNQIIEKEREIQKWDSIYSDIKRIVDAGESSETKK